MWTARNPVINEEKWVVYTPKLHLGYEACHSGGLQVNFHHVGIFTMHRNLNTREFSLLAAARTESAPLGQAAQLDLSHCTGPSCQ